MRILNKLAEKRTIFHLLFPLACLIFAKPHDIYLFIGTGLIILGEIVRIISAGHIMKNEQLTVSGPYAYTRNPLYLGSFLMGLGISFMTGYPLIVIPVYLFLFALIYIPTIKGEEVFLERKFGDAYIHYKLSVPAFFPSLTKRITGSKGKFQWSRVRENNEHRSLIFSLLLIFLFFLKKLLV